MKLYAGERRKDGSVKVIVWDDVSFGMKYARYTRLDARPDLVEDASAGFDWGRICDGASALATAILADCLGEQAARLHHRAFAREVVQRFGPDRWKLGEEEVADAIERLVGSTGRPQSAVAPRPAPAEPEHVQLASLAAWLAGDTRPARFRPAVRVG